MLKWERKEECIPNTLQRDEALSKDENQTYQPGIDDHFYVPLNFNRGAISMGLAAIKILMTAFTETMVQFV